MRVLLVMDYCTNVATALKDQGYDVTAVGTMDGIDLEQFDVSIVHLTVGVSLGGAMLGGPAYGYCDRLNSTTKCYIIDPNSGGLPGLRSWPVRGVLHHRGLAARIGSGFYKSTFESGAPVPDPQC